MTPIELLNHNIDVAVFYMFGLIINVMGTTLATVVLVQALLILFSTKKQNASYFGTGRIRKLLIWALVVQILLNILFLPFLCASRIIKVKETKIIDDILPSTYSPSKRVQILAAVEYILKSPIVVITDGLVVWRAWCLYPHSRRVKILLSLAMVSLAGIVITDIGYEMFRWLKDTSINAKTTSNIIGGMLYFFDLGVNFLATVLIIRIAWKHWRALKASSLNPNKSRVVFILRRLIETGNSICVVQLVLAILMVTYRAGEASDPGFLISYIMVSSSDAFIAAHPGLMIIVCHRSSTDGDSVDFEPGIGRPTAPHEEAEKKSHLTTIRFAPDFTATTRGSSHSVLPSQESNESREHIDSV